MKKKDLLIVIVLTILVVTWFIVDGTKTYVQTSDYEQKLKAAEQTEACMAWIRDYRIAQGLVLNEEADPNGTGIIGLSYSEITTTLGNLEAKRTSTNPNMAAIIVDMINELGLNAGDKVAINTSGSFPALNIAVMAAVETLGLDPIQVASFGASTHGANDPDFTYVDWEHVLVEAGLFAHKSQYFSIGGMLDVGEEMPDNVRTTIVERLESYGYTLLYESDLLQNIAERYALYNDYGDIRAFINVGGNDVSFGDSNIIVHADGGILTELSENDQSTGLVQLFLQNGVPVIHLLNIKSIATQYGLPIDPVPLPKPGEGGVYYAYSYVKPIVIVGLTLAFLVLVSSWYLHQKKENGRIVLLEKRSRGH